MGDSEAHGSVIAGRYEICEVIGRGGMGVVYRAIDRTTKREVALKSVDDPVRFDREARNTARCAHRNIVVVHDVGHGVDRAGRDVHFIVMELLHGHTLKEHLCGQRLEWAETIEIVAQVAAALACVHEKGIVHRDLKPSNIFIVDDGAGTVKLLDFGLARDLARAEDVLTKSRTIVGTTPYLAPEQLAEKPDDANPASDLHALGIVWWEMLVGKSLFQGATEQKTVENVGRKAPVRPSDEIKGIPHDVDEIVLRLLAKDAGGRGTLAELRAELEQVAARLPASSSRSRERLVDDKTQHQRPSRSSSRRHPLWVSPLLRIIASVVLVGSFAVLGFIVLTATSTPTANGFVALPMDGSKALVPLEPPKEEPDPRLVALGREMFQDTALSPNHDIACATCHPLANGAMTAEPQTVLGEDHTRAPWNISSLWNAPLMYVYSWKGDATFADIVERASTKPYLMGNLTIEALTKRVAPLYAGKFQALGVPFDKQGIAMVFDAYLRHIEPRGDRADAYFAGNDKALIDLERRGAKDFEDYGCIACHQGRGLGGNMMARFGVMVDNPYVDRHTCDDGTYCRSDADCAISGGGTCTHPGEIRQQDLGELPAGKQAPIAQKDATFRFRVPSLRNVGRTDPYFHDGSARTLEEAVKVMGKLQLGRELDDQQANEIAAFLRSLDADWSTAEQEEIDKVMKAKRGKQ